MTTTDSSSKEQLRIDEGYERFFDDLYHMGRPDEIFDTAPAVRRKARPGGPRRTPRRRVQRPRSGRRTATRRQ
jgi:hypothetical protein